MIEGGANLALRSHPGETPLEFAFGERRKELAPLIETALAGRRGVRPGESRRS